MEVTDWDKDRVELKWTKPISDGGSPILKYIVECREKNQAEWIKCYGSNDNSTTAKVTDIIQSGKTYEFRVKAVNKAGEGEPSEPTQPVRHSCK